MGGPHFGGLFFLFFLFVVALAIGGARRRRMHGDWARGPMGHGPWGNHSSDGDPRRSWMSEMHRQMHEADAAKAPSTTSTPTGTTSTPADTTPAAG
jgi:hypothetical protein